MLTSISVLAIFCWVLLLLTFLMAHAPERSLSEIIRELR